MSRSACFPWDESTTAYRSRSDPDVIFAAFGDMMRVPGTQGSPLEHKARGMDVRIVYSPSDALKLARLNPEKHVMFFAIGFETTAPSTALTVMRAKAEGIHNFSVFCNHVTIIPGDPRDSRFPRHAPRRFHRSRPRSTVIGCRPYEWIAQNERKPIVVSGFEPLDMLQSIVMLLRQLKAGEAKVENQYKRVVPWEGNRPRSKPWPRFSNCALISNGGDWDSSRSRRLRMREKYAEWDAEQRFEVPGIRVTDPKAAQCGEVLKGVLKPHNVNCSARSARRRIRSAHSWCHRKDHARPITTTNTARPGKPERMRSGSLNARMTCDAASRSVPRPANRDGARCRRQSQPPTGRRAVRASALWRRARPTGRRRACRHRRNRSRDHHRQLRRQAAAFSRRLHR